MKKYKIVSITAGRRLTSTWWSTCQPVKSWVATGPARKPELPSASTSPLTAPSMRSPSTARREG